MHATVSSRRLPFAVALLLAVIASLAGLPPAGASPGPGSPDGAGGASSTDVPRLVVVGAPGLAWSDLARAASPALEELADSGSVGSLTVRGVRTRSCAVDGWLTLSAGRRAADLPGGCRDPLPVSSDGTAARWSDYLAAAEADSYGARPGTLGDAVAASGGCVQTVGPGAAIGGADGAGRVTHHVSTLPPAFDCPVVLVDAGVLPGRGRPRADAVARVDATVGAVRAVDPGADVIVAGVGDGTSPVRPRLLVAAGPSFPAGLLGSASTRQPGVAQLQDLTATVLARVGADTDALTGRPLTVEPSTDPGSLRTADRVALETRAATMRAVGPQVTAWLAVAFAAWAGLVALRWRRRGSTGGVPSPLTVLGVAVASVPVATFAANLGPWWGSTAPGAVFAVLLVVTAAAVTLAGLWAERRAALGALRLVAVITLLVLGGDVLTGSRLQLASVFGQNPVVGGRFYGLGNTSFALYGLAVLVVVAWAATSTRWSRRTAGTLGAALLLAALAVEASPSAGADFGGPPGLLLGGLVVLAGATGVRITARRAVVAVTTAAALAALVAVLDWLRPLEQRTHLGEFVETVVSGEAGPVVARKLSQNVANLGSAPLVAISLAAVLLTFVAWRTGWRPVPEGAAVLRGAGVMAGVGFVVNDSGLVIPAFVALVLAPLLVVAGPPRTPGNFYAVPELAAHYDEEFAGRPDLPFYVALAERLGARRVADVGAGTGLLCSLLAGHGHDVIGVEPQRTMLDIARRQPNAAQVRWLHGTAEDLPSNWADLVVMTGHVAQYFLDDEAWRLVLTECRRALRPGGHVAFEIRNAAVEEWRSWASDEPAPAMAGTLRSDVERHADLVTHTDHWAQGSRQWTTSETLRFPSWDAVEAGLAAAGLVVVRTWGDWSGAPVTETSPEWIVLARASARCGPLPPRPG